MLKIKLSLLHFEVIGSIVMEKASVLIALEALGGETYSKVFASIAFGSSGKQPY